MHAARLPLQRPIQAQPDANAARVGSYPPPAPPQPIALRPQHAAATCAAGKIDRAPNVALHSPKPFPESFAMFGPRAYLAHGTPRKVDKQPSNGTTMAHRRTSPTVRCTQQCALDVRWIYTGD